MYLSGTVIHGKWLWKTIGFPTANIHIWDIYISPATYILRVVYSGTEYIGVGVYLAGTYIFEVHILGFSADIYGETLDIYIGQQIRENKKFGSMEELKEQIQRDIEYVEGNYKL